MNRNMDHSVRLLSIEQLNQQPLRPIHLSPTKLTRNPNSVVTSSHGKDSQDLKGNEMVIKNGHEHTTGHKHHKHPAEYDEKKHVYKTDHNTFEITVKLKKPHGSKGTSESKKLVPVVELAEGHKCHEQPKKHNKKMPTREGSWGDLLARMSKVIEKDGEQHPRKEARPKSLSRRQPDDQTDGAKHAQRNKKEMKQATTTRKPKNKSIFTQKKRSSDHSELESEEEEDRAVEGRPDDSDVEVIEDVGHAETERRRMKLKHDSREKKMADKVEAEHFRLIQQLQEENSIQKDQISLLNTELEKAQSELREYMETIKELFDLATVLKNENQNLLETQQQEHATGEKLMSAVTQNEMLKRQLAQLTQQHELIIKPKDEELSKLKNLVNDVKTTLEEEIQELQSMPVTTTSVSSAAAAKCSSSSFFRQLNLTDEEHEREHDAEASLASDIPTIDDDDESVAAPSQASKSNKPKATQTQQQIPTNTHIPDKRTNEQREQMQGQGKNNKDNNKTKVRPKFDDHPPYDDNDDDSLSSSTQYLNLVTASDKYRDFEQDDDFDGLRN